MTRSSPPVVVFRASDICFLGIIRSLADHKIPFRTVTFTWPGCSPWWSEYSQFYHKDIVISNPYEYPDIALDELVEFGEKLIQYWGRRLLAIPSSDTNLMFFINNEKTLSKYFCLTGHVSFDSYRKDVIDKYSCYKLLSNSRVSVPISYACNNREDVNKICHVIEYPCIYKPSVKDYGQTFYKIHNGLKAIECSTKQQLENGLNHCLDQEIKVIAQEKIFFDNAKDEIPLYVYSDQNFNIRLAATGLKEVIQPYPYGTANILRMTWVADLLFIAQEVVSSLQWRGLLMIELIKDKKDNCWKVIEVNTRPWLFIRFYERADLNYLKYLYLDWLHDLDGCDLPTLTVPQESFLQRSPIYVDINGLVQYLSDGERETIFNGASPSGLKEFLANYSENIFFSYYEHNDPKPGIESIEYLAKSIYGINYKAPLKYILNSIYSKKSF